MVCVVQSQGLEVHLAKLPTSILAQVDGHGRAKDSETFVEADDLLLVQPEQRPIDQLVRLLESVFEIHIGFHFVQQFAECGLGEKICALASRRQAIEQMLQQPLCCVSAQVGGLGKRPPISIQCHAQGFVVQRAQSDTARGAVVSVPIAFDAAQKAEHPFGQCLMALVLQPLCGDAQMQHPRVALGHVRCDLSKVVDQRPLQPRRFVETFVRVTPHAVVDVGRQHGVVAGDAEILQVVQRFAHAFGLQTAHAHQFVSGNPFIGVCFDERAHDVQQLLSIGSLHRRQLGACLFNRLNAQRRWEYLRAILLARQQLGVLQPGDSGSHSAVVGSGVALERRVVFVAEYLAGRGDNFAVHSFAPDLGCAAPAVPLGFPVARDGNEPTG